MRQAARLTPSTGPSQGSCIMRLRRLRCVCSLEQGRVEQKRDSSLKAQTRCVRAFPDAQGFALSSVEGRVAIEYLDMDPSAQVRGFRI